MVCQFDGKAMTVNLENHLLQYGELNPISLNFIYAVLFR